MNARELIESISEAEWASKMFFKPNLPSGSDLNKEAMKIVDKDYPELLDKLDASARLNGPRLSPADRELARQRSHQIENLTQKLMKRAHAEVRAKYKPSDKVLRFISWMTGILGRKPILIFGDASTGSFDTSYGDLEELLSELAARGWNKYVHLDYDPMGSGNSFNFKVPSNFK